MEKLEIYKDFKNSIAISVIISYIFVLILFFIYPQIEDFRKFNESIILSILGNLGVNMPANSIEVTIALLYIDRFIRIFPYFNWVWICISFVFAFMGLPFYYVLFHERGLKKALKKVNDIQAKIIENQVRITFPDLKFEYIEDRDYRVQIISDYGELMLSYYAGCYKSTIILSGCILEGCLIDLLKQDDIETYTLFKQYYSNVKVPAKIEDMKLVQLIKIKYGNHPLKEQSANLLRNFRNIIHPDVQIRKNLGYSPNKEDAKFIVGTLINILKSFPN